MTCGLYTIRFEGTDKVYVGQSNNIERRFKEHLCKFKLGHKNYKLKEAYIKYGAPIFDIWEACNIDELSNKEIELIKELDSFISGYNLTLGGETGHPIGLNNPAIKWDKETYIEVLNLLVDIRVLSYLEISQYTGMPEANIGLIARGVLHKAWLSKEFPDIYIRLPNNTELRYLKSRDTMKLKTSSAGKGTINPVIVGPDGVTQYVVENISQFAKEHNLSTSTLNYLLNNKCGVKVCGGFSRLNDTDAAIHNLRIYCFVSPDGFTHDNITNLAEFAKLHGLVPNSLRYLVSGKSKKGLYKGWAVG